MIAQIKQVSRFWWILLGCMAVIVPSTAVVTVYIYHLPPVQVLDMREDDGIAVSGKHLNLIGRKQENQNCITQTVRWLYRPDPIDPEPDPEKKTREWIELTSAPHSPPVFNTAPYRLMVQIPRYIAPGTWFYLGQAIDTCKPIIGDGPRVGKPYRITIMPDTTQVVVPNDEEMEKTPVKP